MLHVVIHALALLSGILTVAFAIGGTLLLLVDGPVTGDPDRTPGLADPATVIRLHGAVDHLPADAVRAA